MSGFEVPVFPVGCASVAGAVRWSEVEGLVLLPGDLPAELVEQLQRAAEAPMLTPAGGPDQAGVLDDVDWIEVLPGSSRDAALAWCAGLGAHDAVASFKLLRDVALVTESVT